MANTHHTGIPKLQWVGAYPPCTPSASISVDLSPFCAGDSVMFTPTLNCVENVIIASYAWVVNGVIKSTSPDPFVTTELLNNDKVYFFFIANENPYFSNVITVVEKTEGCEEPITEVKYGLLYNWYAATDARGFTSSGDFVVPTRLNWQTLETDLGGSSIAGGKLKEIGFDYWYDPNTGATNISMFNGKGSGNRQITGVFASKLIIAQFWANTYGGYGLNYYQFILVYNSAASQSTGISYAKHGYSVRLVRPATESELLLADGTPCDNYTGNDGKSYRTVKIGTQVWTAANSAETKYRNGDLIPEVTDNSAWAALETGALCAYDNDWGNAFEETVGVETKNVRLSPGFYPIGITEYGGILYIVSGKKPTIATLPFTEMNTYSKGDVVYTELLDQRYYYESLQDGNNTTLPINSNEYWYIIGDENNFINTYGEVEFGSYPSPEKLNPAILDTSINFSINSDEHDWDKFKYELYNPKIINNSFFRAGNYVIFKTIDTNDILTFVSYNAFTYNATTEKVIKDELLSVRNIYKVKLYQQLTNGFIDLTNDVWEKYAKYLYALNGEELNSTGTPKYWFQDSEFKYYCPHNFKGKLIISVELEDYDLFDLQYCSVILDEAQFIVHFDLNLFENTGWSIGSEEVVICYTLNGDEPNFGITTPTNFKETLPLDNVKLYFPDADINKLLKYKIRPWFLSGFPSPDPEFKEFPQEFLNKHTIEGTTILISELSRYKIVPDPSSYIFDSDPTKGGRITTKLMLQDSDGNFLDNDLAIINTADPSWNKNAYKFFYHEEPEIPYLGYNLGVYEIDYTNGTAKDIVPNGSYPLPIANDVDDFILNLVDQTVVYEPYNPNWGTTTLSVITNKSFSATTETIIVSQNGSILTPTTTAGKHNYVVNVGQEFTISGKGSVGINSLETGSYSAAIYEPKTIYFGVITKLQIKRTPSIDNPSTNVDRFNVPMTSILFGTAVPIIVPAEYNITQSGGIGNLIKTNIIAGTNPDILYDNITLSHIPIYTITFIGGYTESIYVNLIGQRLVLKGTNLFKEEIIDIPLQT